MRKQETVYIAVARPDGGFSVMEFTTKSFHPSGDVNFASEPSPGNVEALLEKLRVEQNHEWMDYWPLSKEQVAFYLSTADDHLRSARQYTKDGSFGYDIEKARELHKNKLRSERTPLLAALDVEFMRAVETADFAKQMEVSSKKQALRDVTKHPGIEAASTPQELKKITI